MLLPRIQPGEKEAEAPLKKKVIEQEAADFLKFMQASEYKNH